MSNNSHANAAVLRELMKAQKDLGTSRAQIYNALAELFSSEKEWTRWTDSFRVSDAGEAYTRWTEHRIATGHTGAGVLSPLN